MNMDEMTILKELIESKLDTLNQKIDMNHTLQMEISKNTLAQATKTNGRVTKLEGVVDKIKDDERVHTINCPRIPELKTLSDKVQAMDDSMIEFKFIKKYPKLSLAVLVGAVLFTVCSLIYTSYEMRTMAAELAARKVQTEVTR